MKVLVPTLKRTDHSKGCVYKNVLSYGNVFKSVPHNDILKAAYFAYNVELAPFGTYKASDNNVKVGAELSELTYPADISYSAEVIDEKHHYVGKKLDFLKEHAIARPAGNYLLSAEDGGIFLNL